MKTDNNDIASCVVCGVGGADIKLSDKKMCTSCEQKVLGSPTPRSNNEVDNTGEVSAGLDRMKLSNDDVDGVDISGSALASCTAGDKKTDKKTSTSCEQNCNRVDISDDKLFADPPPKPECPICMIPVPHATGDCGVKVVYQPCCGKVICRGCVEASKSEMKKGTMKEWCPLCRVPIINSSKERISFLRKRMGVNDSEAFYLLGLYYLVGTNGLPHDMNKAIKLWNRAAELGSINAHNNLGITYNNGEAVERDMKKAVYHFSFAAVGGHEAARYSLGGMEIDNGNFDLSIKHFMIGAKSGHDESLKLVGEGYKDGYVTKDEYASALRSYQCSRDEMKSEQRTKVASRK